LLEARGIELAPEVVEKLDAYRRLLWMWNERLNLTRHTTLEKFIDRDVVDSLQMAELLQRGERVLDVGSGGGVPGIVLAICRPDLRLVLCDSTQKKARVLRSMVGELDIRVEAFGCRVEELLELRNFETLVARAVAPMAKILHWLKPHWDAFERLLLVKGRNWTDERSEARHQGLLRSLQLRRVATYKMCGTEGESVILQIRASGE